MPACADEVIKQQKKKKSGKSGKSGRYKKGAKRNRKPDPRLSVKGCRALQEEKTILQREKSDLECKVQALQARVAELEEEVRRETKGRLFWEAAAERYKEEARQNTDRRLYWEAQAEVLSGRNRAVRSDLGLLQGRRGARR